ncbi:uncharacterized protein N7459_006318 [Penicillium hispanicum]|uniref:uncharacterized protein n=1 Tax=Penicillium hispanicum TaxID=1080232 RepID=UPI0025414753|nr:uncharacterized protein N7459_006318 [Penicillium hispanicum]KAJ5580333.1 hypothetical protein N7459_006318 [Penicillium hispanicum]
MRRAWRRRSGCSQVRRSPCEVDDWRAELPRFHFSLLRGHPAPFSRLQNAEGLIISDSPSSGLVVSGGNIPHREHAQHQSLAHRTKRSEGNESLVRVWQPSNHNSQLADHPRAQNGHPVSILMMDDVSPGMTVGKWTKRLQPLRPTVQPGCPSHLGITPDCEALRVAPPQSQWPP